MTTRIFAVGFGVAACVLVACGGNSGSGAAATTTTSGASASASPSGGGGLCPLIFSEQKIDVSGQVSLIEPLANGIYLGIIEDATGQPCEFLTTERPALHSQFTLTSYIAHRNDKAQPTEFLYPASVPKLAAGTSAALTP